MIKISLTNNILLAEQNRLMQNTHNTNITVAPDGVSLFADEEEVANWINNPNNEIYAEDIHSVQGWTHVANYEAHPLSLSGGKIYYIHARINSNNKLEFAAFDNKIENNIVSDKKFLFSNIINGNNNKQLSIATKEESEKYLLTEDRTKIKVSALPKYAGYLCDHADVIINNTTYNTFGNIYTYWYTISGNILYFCAFPLYKSDKKGLIYGEDGSLTETNIPPTQLNYINADKNDKFKIAIDSIFNKENKPDEDGVYSGAKMILLKYGDFSENTAFASYIISKNNKNIIGNNIRNNISAFSEIGGIYNKNGTLIPADFYDLLIESPAEDGYSHISGGIISKTSIIEQENETIIEYKDAKCANMFIVSSINDHISIGISDSIYVFGEGSTLDDVIIDDNYIISTGGNGGGGNITPGKKPTKIKNVKSLRINAGDIGYEYSGTLNSDLLSRAIYTVNTPISQVSTKKVTVENEDAEGVFEYALDTAKLASIDKSYISDSDYDILTKKLSRKLDVSICCNPEHWSRNTLVDRFLIFKDFFIDAGSENYVYIAPDGAGRGKKAMRISASDASTNDTNIIKINLISEFLSNGANPQINWPASIDIENNNFKFKNNTLSVSYKSITEYKPNSLAIEQITPGVSTENTNIIIDNTIFLYKHLNINNPITVSFPVPPEVAGRPKVKICYKIRKVKLIPNSYLFNNIIDLFMSKEQNNELDNYFVSTLPSITYSKLIDGTDIEYSLLPYIKSGKTLKSKITYEGLQERVIEPEIGQWGALHKDDNVYMSVLPPIEINLCDIASSGNPNEDDTIFYESIIDDAHETCPIATDKKKFVNWNHEPKMKINMNLSEYIDKDNNPEQSVIIEYMELGDGWWEAATQNNEDGWRTDTERYRFSIDAPEGFEYGSKTANTSGKLKINLFTNAENTSNEMISVSKSMEQ